METMENISVPPGFRFHPTEEELVGYYLNRRVNSLKIDLNVIVDIDLYRIEPWDIQERCRLGYEEQTEWYFFSHKDRKYPTGTRTNRATSAGFWKATGRDKAVVSKERMIGMRKTLVFYRGRAPNGTKTDWIMHEYRLQTSHHAPTQEEGWVVCRAFKKPSPSCHPKHPSESAYWSNNNNINSLNYYNNYSLPSSSTGPDLSSPSSSMQTIHAINNHQTVDSNSISNFHQFPFNHNNNFDQNYSLLELPQLDTTRDFDNDDQLINSQNQEGITHLLGCFPDDLL